MERRIREEHVTKAILGWLETNGWSIVCFDFPQSGTGKVLHSNNRLGLKNKDSIIPDIVAVKNSVVIFMENKDKYVLSDFIKIEKILQENTYSISIAELLSGYTYESIYYGVGFPVSEKDTGKISQNKSKVDFIIHSDGESVEVVYEREKIFIL